MGLYKDIGDDAYNTETGDGEDEVSYTPVESEVQTSEEKSDAQLIADGEIEVDGGDGEIFVDRYAVYGKKVEEKKEEEADSDDEEEEEPQEPEEEETGEEEEPEEEEEKVEEEEEKPSKEKKKTGEEDPEVVKLAKRYSQKRINKISREKFQLRDENEELRRKLKELEEKTREAAVEKRKVEHIVAKPKYEDFDDDAEFYEALGRWSAKDEIYAHEEASRTVEEEPSIDEQEQQTFENVRDKILTDGEEKYDDFAELVLKTDGSIAITKEMVIAAGDSDNAADIFYYLGQNPEESHRIAKLHGNQIAREIGRIESQFLVNEVETHTPEQDHELIEKTKKKTKTKKPASPPTPVKPISGVGGKVSVDLDKADISDYFAARGYDRSGMKKRLN